MVDQQPAQQRRVNLSEIKQFHTQEKRKLNRLLERQQMINQMAMEAESTLLATKELTGKNDVDSIIPLGAGIFVNAKIVPHSLKRSLPGNVVIDSTAEQIEKDLMERMVILSKDGEIIHKQVTEAKINLQSLTHVLQMARKGRAAGKK
ncbi:MAG: hypothetical protein AABX02_02880 [archaeon]